MSLCSSFIPLHSHSTSLQLTISGQFGIYNCEINEIILKARFLLLAEIMEFFTLKSEKTPDDSQGETLRISRLKVFVIDVSQTPEMIINHISAW